MCAVVVVNNSLDIDSFFVAAEVVQAIQEMPTVQPLFLVVVKHAPCDDDGGATTNIDKIT